MKKALRIGFKDLKIVSRDRAALIFMLAAPFLLTLAMGLVTGRFSRSGSSSGISGVPIVVVNQDEGQFGEALETLLFGDELATLLAPSASEDAAAGRQQVDDDEITAVVLIPAGFSEGILSGDSGSGSGEVALIELYTNPARPVGSGVVEAIVENFLNRVETGLVGGQVAVTQLVQLGLIDPAEIPVVAQELGTAVATGEARGLVRLASAAAPEEEEPSFDILAFLAPGMAVLFLMFTVTYGGRSLLTERREGTLPRLLTTATSAPQVLGGKVVGIFLTGVLQMTILIGGTSILFGLDWGDPVALSILILATVAGATGWGLLLAAVARTPAQVSNIGTAMMLVFGIIGGSFTSAAAFPEWVQTLRLVTPNAWALDGMAELALGGSLSDIWLYIGMLLLMALVLFAISVYVFRRRAALSTG